MRNNTYLRNQTIYQVDVRNYSKKGTFQALVDDFPRLRDLGVQFVYLLPIHPIGVLARKGNLGSPYSIQDYRAINPSLGTMEDFAAMVRTAHAWGLKIMMDIVFNHTSRDAIYVNEHPSWYFYKDGKLANRIGDWSDIADLNFEVQEVQDYLIETLVFWAEKGVDGFRCDVAPIIPLSFWMKAREAVAAVNPRMVWLSESVEPGFIKWLRAQGYVGQSDAEMYQAFDVLYDYDVFPFLLRYLEGKGTLDEYLDKVAAQEYIYPADYRKIHFLENHDQERIFSRFTGDNKLKNLTAWSFFQNGMGFLYAGQEVKSKHRPSIFDKDPLDLKIKDQSFYDFIKRLTFLKTIQIFFIATRFDILKNPNPDVIYAQLAKDNDILYGIFNLTNRTRELVLDIPNGRYYNLISLEEFDIKNGHVVILGPMFLIRIA